MSADLPPVRRVQEQQPCPKAGGPYVWQDCEPWRMAGQCDGCRGDGTRWVTVGTLRHRGTAVVPAVRGYVHQDRYSIEETPDA